LKKSDRQYIIMEKESRKEESAMKTSQDLRRELSRIDGKSYGAYKDIAGQYDFGQYTLCIDHVQGDPFASPSKLRVVVGQKLAKFPEELFDKRHKRIALEDHLIRLFDRTIYRFQKRISGSGKSGKINISRCGQQVLERSAMQMGKDKLEARFEVGFPARGRTILARELEKILYDVLPDIIENTLFYGKIDQKKLQDAIDLSEDQQAIRDALDENGLVAFIADGSVLPRESGISDKPLSGGIPIVSPKEMEVTLKLPHKGLVRGMGIKKGITLIVGGGYHGKSTLLKAVEKGVYNHILGDGREYVITEDSAAKIRAEDGRSIQKDDISLFINHLPNGKDTKKFTTENASGSTSQAANVVEAMEAGTKLFLIDEDTSATNFMIRDEMMQRLVSPEKEPITPFIDRIRPLYDQLGISTVLVVGSSGTYFSIADCVIGMQAYKPCDMTEEAKRLAEEYGKRNETQPVGKLDINFQRILEKGAFVRDDRGMKIKTRGTDTLSISREDIDLRYMEQLVDKEQVAMLGQIVKYAEERVIDGRKTLSEIVDIIEKKMERDGFLSVVSGAYCPEFLAEVRRQEIVGCFNRLRTLRVQ
jgi:predicted ABC-class ATPase